MLMILFVGVYLGRLEDLTTRRWFRLSIEGRLSKHLRSLLLLGGTEDGSTVTRLLIVIEHVLPWPHSPIANIQFSHWPIGQGPAECAKRLN